MKAILPLITFLLFLPDVAYSNQFKVTEVYDGDTVNAKSHDAEIKVRLIGIDAPEILSKKTKKGQPYSQEAKKHLEALILNKTVKIRDYGPDRYNHVLGEIFLDGENINLEMIRAGLAEVYKWDPAGGPDLNAYQGAEAKAREAGTGMWSLACG